MARLKSERTKNVEAGKQKKKKKACEILYNFHKLQHGTAKHVGTPGLQQQPTIRSPFIRNQPPDIWLTNDHHLGLIGSRTHSETHSLAERV